jgi:hypothetical protein
LTPGKTDWKPCPNCKQREPVREKMWCWVCNRCDHVVEYKPGTLLDIKTKLEDGHATKARSESKNNQ